MDPGPARRIARIARRQHGVFSRSQALACGLPGRTLRNWVARGRYRRVFRGVYAIEGVPSSWELRAMAVVLRVGGDAVLARQSAARVHGLELPRHLRDGMGVLVRNRSFTLDDDGITAHRTRNLPANHVQWRRGLPVTTPTRTLCDLAAVVAPDTLRRMVAQAVRLGLTDAAALSSALDELGRVPGKVNMARVCAELSPLEADCRSVLESKFLTLVTRAGLPPTAMNHPVVDADGRRRFLDAAYLPQAVGVELDSTAAHGSRIDLDDDDVRHNAIVLAGWFRILHFTWWDVQEHPDRVVATVRAALAAAEAAMRPG